VIFPVLGRFELFGLRLPWLLLGVLAYPLLVALAWMYSRSAERLEQVFADHIQS
jgi:Na+/melibiose symporter-like transporter